MEERAKAQQSNEYNIEEPSIDNRHLINGIAIPHMSTNMSVILCTAGYVAILFHLPEVHIALEAAVGLGRLLQSGHVMPQEMAQRGSNVPGCFLRKAMNRHWQP